MPIPKLIYHATSNANLDLILSTGIKLNKLKEIFFADSAIGAAKFLVVRGIKVEDIVVFVVQSKKLDKNSLEISYDHDETFFGCKAWVYSKDVPVGLIENVLSVGKK